MSEKKSKSKKTASRKPVSNKKPVAKPSSGKKSSTKPSVYLRDNKIRVVAIGASAGGLEPIEQFFDATLPVTGLAYVVIQHLSPDFRSMMSELLARHSELEILHITNGIKIEPNKIYLNPPRMDLSILEGHLYLRDINKLHEVNLPINSFMRSLAAEQGPAAIGVILSGTGSDGSQGILDIQTAGGTAFVQTPGSAKFDGMPRSVIEECPSCISALPGEIPGLISRVVAGEEPEAPDTEESDELPGSTQNIIQQLQDRFGADFGYYKNSTVNRRIARRAQLGNFSGLDEYAKQLAKDPEELERLYSDLLIGVTTFFRDREAFDVVAEHIVPDLVERMRNGHTVRLWVPGCASGEEAYSLAIIISEHARSANVNVNLKIFATDIHFSSLETASRGMYPPDSLRSVHKEILDRYFDVIGDHYQVRQRTRQLVVFSRHNVIKDPPFTRMDLVSCRNLLIYFDDEAQRKAIAMFHFALRENGALLLGPSETTGGLSDEFEVVDGRWRLFTKRRNVKLLEATRLLPASGRRHAIMPVAGVADRELAPVLSTSASALQRQSLIKTYDALLARFVDTSLLVSMTGELMHIFGDGTRFLKWNTGNFSKHIVDLVDSELRPTITAGLERMRSAPHKPFMRTLDIVLDGDTTPTPVRIVFEILDEGATSSGNEILVLLTPQPKPVRRSKPSPAAQAADERRVLDERVQELERDLRFSEESLQSTIEELETSNEELQATNEELMAANEELHSVNEEVHAVNQELYTVSAEHQLKIDELLELTDDMDNLLRSTNIGVVFLDRQLGIRRITPAISDTFNILPRDIGRPIDHVTSRFEFSDIAGAIKNVINGGGVVERACHVGNKDFLLRILPYRNQNNEVTGAVLTAIDISELAGELARAHRNLVQFADIVSHDLKTPLRAIRNAGQWIVEDLGDSASDEIRDHVEKLGSHTERLGEMLSDLREYSNYGSPVRSAESVDLQALVDEFQDYFEDAHLTLNTVEPLPSIQASKPAMRLVLHNLLDNAVKHNDHTPVVVEVEAIRQDDEYIISITDDGPGIQPRYQDKIFLPFRKLKPSTESAGTGMGLALVRKVVEEHGGRIEVTSDPERVRGTKFSTIWPISQTGPTAESA